MINRVLFLSGLRNLQMIVVAFLSVSVLYFMYQDSVTIIKMTEQATIKPQGWGLKQEIHMISELFSSKKKSDGSEDAAKWASMLSPAVLLMQPIIEKADSNEVGASPLKPQIEEKLESKTKCKNFSWTQVLKSLMLGVLFFFLGVVAKSKKFLRVMNF
jgi:high-affinity Fe2+/Pb2+ permease